MTDWRDRAACVGMDPDIWFPERGQSPDRAKAICNSCSARSECLEEHIFEVRGVFGGLTARERMHLRVERGLTAPPPPIDHGTPNGYRQHRKRDERACRLCLLAWQIYKGAAPRLRAVEDVA